MRQQPGNTGDARQICFGAVGFASTGGLDLVIAGFESSAFALEMLLILGVHLALGVAKVG